MILEPWNLLADFSIVQEEHAHEAVEGQGCEPVDKANQCQSEDNMESEPVDVKEDKEGDEVNVAVKEEFDLSVNLSGRQSLPLPRVMNTVQVCSLSLFILYWLWLFS